jgi:hypothetical protein
MDYFVVHMVSQSSPIKFEGLSVVGYRFVTAVIKLHESARDCDENITNQRSWRFMRSCISRAKQTSFEVCSSAINDVEKWV